MASSKGILIPMLTTFLNTNSNYKLWFKIYIVSINTLALGQTIIHIIQAFEVIDMINNQGALVAAAPIFTGVIGATVQAFFIHRCWRIYRQRILPTLPLLVLWLASLVSATMIGAYLTLSPGSGADNRMAQLSALVMIWVISSLLFDLVTTSTTVVYLCRVRISSNGGRSILSTVWNVIWASAAPPLVLMFITLVDYYMIPHSPGVVGSLAVAMSAKFFVLSLMINLVGQEYIRRQFERPYPSPVAQQVFPSPK
ncbi:hypothetical protein OPQ81_007377 [Rhizoctonia solani]|nr:hypothetical protein OPQ81_007377 [Rhizoctonia solani]